jgi:putative spermidine/putrescine transport system substrate-binding protein/spermidine/putrescine transport system substrate-binding protein
MKQIFWLCCFVCAQTLAGPRPVLHLYGWKGALPEETMQHFERICDCRVDLDVAGDNQDMEDRLASGAVGYDVVFPPSFAIPGLIRKKLLQPLDHARLSNLANLDPVYMNQAYDPGNVYSVPAQLSLTAVGYNIEKMKQLGVDPYSWSAVFDPRVLVKLKGHVAVADSPIPVFVAALLYLGCDPNTASSEDYQRARDVIMAARPYWGSISNEHDWKGLVTGDIWVSLGYSTVFFQAREAARTQHRPYTVGYVTQREGNELVINCMAVPAGAAHPELAMRFINFMLAGRNAADLTNSLGATNPVRAAEPYFRDDLKYHPVINPDVTALRRWVVLHDQTPRMQRRIERLWDEIRTSWHPPYSETESRRVHVR